MKASVVIPTYNREKYICQAIDSVLDQSFTDLEIIVVDDGSTDNTKEKLQHYGPRIRYLYTHNGGPAGARNVGMRNARGEYIAFLDSDDLYYPFKIEFQVALLDNLPEIAMVYTEGSALDDSGVIEEFHLKTFHRPAYSKPELRYESIFSHRVSLSKAGLNAPDWADRYFFYGNIFDTYLHNIIVLTPTIMFRRVLLGTVGFQDERYRLFEELDFVLRICRHHVVGFLDVPTYKVRYHSRQISRTSGKSGIVTTIEKQRNVLDIIQRQALEDQEYFVNHRDQINRRLAVLNKSLAVPLLATREGAKAAREHLEKCRAYGHPEPLLRLVTFLPFSMRRVILKGLSLTRLLW